VRLKTEINNIHGNRERTVSSKCRIYELQALKLEEK
jgi:hypothetical protein